MNRYLRKKNRKSLVRGEIRTSSGKGKWFKVNDLSLSATGAPIIIHSTCTYTGTYINTYTQAHTHKIVARVSVPASVLLAKANHPLF
jgi:hypothetical protein